MRQLWLGFATILLCCSFVAAQPPGAPMHPGAAMESGAPMQQEPLPGHDPLGENLFPPELVMQNQQALGLTTEQRTAIRSEIQKAQARFTELQFQLQDEMETLTSLLKQARPDEQQVLAQLDKVLNLEREIKRTHFSLVLRMKNRLTPEQQAKLQELKLQELKRPRARR